MSAYATLQDLEDLGLPGGALDQVLPDVKLRAIEAASAVADGYLRDRYRLPLTADGSGAFDPALTDAVVQIAIYRLMVRRGYNPDPNSPDVFIRQGYVDAVDWLKRVANGQVQLLVKQADPVSLQPVVSTSCPRGYDAIGPGVSGTGNWGL